MPEVAIFDSLLERVKDHRPLDRLDFMADARLITADIRRRTGLVDEAIALYDELVVRYGEVAMPRVWQAVAMTLDFKGVVIVGQGKLNEAIQAYDELVTRLEDASEPSCAYA
jgi:hypothetical protein